jgi:DNA-directed RNA polymerase subunit RPC12/RpoP
VELEERTIEQLPDRCENCGAELTDDEKRAALLEGTASERVLCTTCSAELVQLPDEDEGSGA